jgi:acyl carrier protein
MSTEDLQTVIQSVFRSVLENPTLFATDDFFACGGDSMLAVDATIKLSESIGREVDMTMIITYPTAAELAGALADMEPDR